MQDDSKLDELMRRLKTGDPQSAREIYERFVERLIALAGTRLGGKLRRKVDPEDVIQSVFHSFFSGQKDGRYKLTNWDELWGLLAAITIHKCGRSVEYFHAACRNVQNEDSTGPMSEDAVIECEAIAREPTPQQVTIFDELICNLLLELEGDDRQILLLGLQGWTTAEIGNEVGCSERTARRVLKGVRRKLEEIRDVC